MFNAPKISTLLPQISEKILHFFILVDSTKCMKSNGEVEVFSVALQNAIQELIRMQERNEGYVFKISIMTFDQDIKWISDSIEVAKYEYSSINVCDYSQANYAKVFTELNNKLKKKEIMTGRIVKPFITLIMGSESNGDNWEQHISDLLKNRLFVFAHRIVILAGDDCCNSTEINRIAKIFVGNGENIISGMGERTLVDAIIQEETRRTNPHQKKIELNTEEESDKSYGDENVQYELCDKCWENDDFI